jgi:hypothetical protein
MEIEGSGPVTGMNTLGREVNGWAACIDTVEPSA